MFYASKQGNVALVTTLLDSGAKVGAPAGKTVFYPVGYTALHGAAHEGHLAVVKLLLARGADANAKDGDGNTPLAEARSAKRTEVAILLERIKGR